MLKSFLGLTSYYRRFVRSYADVSEPLYRLLRGDAKEYRWTGDQQRAFEALNKALTEALLLVHPDSTNPFALQTDASDYAIAAILSQRAEDDGFESVVSYASRQLTHGERKYDTRKKQLLAVIWGCEVFDKYLRSRPFVVETDHANLQWLMKRNSPRGRLARWVMRLQAYDMQIRHRAGKANGNADALSRLPRESNDDIAVAPVLTAAARAIAIIPSLDELL